MHTSPVAASLAALFSELVEGAPGGGGAFILNSGDAGLLRSLNRLSAAEASHSVGGGATIAAHARHLAYGLWLMNTWSRDGSNPFANAKWDEAWATSAVDEAEWTAIQGELAGEARAWTSALREGREVADVELSGMIGSIAHLAYHLGAMRQIEGKVRGPKEGTFA